MRSSVEAFACCRADSRSGVPLLQLLLARLEDLALRRAEFIFINRSFGFSSGDGALGLFNSTGGAGPTLCKHLVQRALHEKVVRDDKQQE